MQEKIKVLSSDYDMFCANAEKMRYKCQKWPELSDIRDKIMPNLKDMLPFIAWILYTAPDPANSRERDVKHFLDTITREYYEYVDEPEDMDQIPVCASPMVMTFDEYIALCESAEEKGPDPDGWPSLAELKSDGVRMLKKNLKKYIRLMEATPCTTPKEKECCQYLNRLVQMNLRFVDEEDGA